MSRRNIVHPEGIPDTTPAYERTYIDSHGYGDGSLNTVAKGYNDKLLFNGAPWTGPIYTTNEGNCNLPPFLKWPKPYYNLFTSMFSTTDDEHILYSKDVNEYESVSDSNVPTQLDFDTCPDSTVANLILVHFAFAELYTHRSPFGWNSHNGIYKFTICINGQDYSLNEAIAANLIEPMVLINRGNQGGAELINSVLNNGTRVFSYYGEAYCNYGWADGNASGNRCKRTAGTYVIFVLKSGSALTSMKTCKIHGGNSQLRRVDAYYVPTSQLNITLKEDTI